MTEEIGSTLPDRAARIAALLGREIKNHEDWIETQLDLAREIGEARKDYSSDIAFGKWFKANGFDDRIGADRRAAYISLARDLELAKTVLDGTLSNDIRRIEKNEFRKMYDLNHPEVSPNGETGKPRRGRPPGKGKGKGKGSRDTPKTDRAYAALVEAKRLGLPIPGKKDFAKLIGVSHMAMEKAMDRYAQEMERNEREDREAETMIADPATTLSVTAKERLEAAIRAAKRALEREFDAKVAEAAKAVIASERAELERLKTEFVHGLDERMKAADERRIKHDRIIAAYDGVLSPKEFNVLRRALHPDRIARFGDDALVEEFNAATRLLNSKKDALVKEESPPSKSSLPSFAEMLARKQAADAERRGRKTTTT